MLNKEQIYSILPMRERGDSTQAIATSLGVHPQTINRWMKKLKEAGHNVAPVKKGRPAIKL